MHIMARAVPVCRFMNGAGGSHFRTTAGSCGFPCAKASHGMRHANTSRIRRTQQLKHVATSPWKPALSYCCDGLRTIPMWQPVHSIVRTMPACRWPICCLPPQCWQRSWQLLIQAGLACVACCSDAAACCGLACYVCLWRFGCCLSGHSQCCANQSLSAGCATHTSGAEATTMGAVQCRILRCGAMRSLISVSIS